MTTRTILTKPVRWRYNVLEGGKVVRKKRNEYALYGCPSTVMAVFWYEERGRYILACRTDTRQVNRRTIGCYYVMPTRAAAIMFALAASN